MNTSILTLKRSLAGLACIFFLWVTAQAQDMLEIEIADVEGPPGELVEIPVYVSTDQDSLGGFQIQITLNRPDIVYFEVDTVIVDLDTSYVCAFDTSGTLISGWEIVEAHCPGGGGTNIRLAGMCQFLIGMSPAIGMYTSGTLLKLFARVRTDLPSFVDDSTAILMLSPVQSFYSDPQGGMISPVSHLDGSVTMVAPAQDTLEIDIADVEGLPGELVEIPVYVSTDQDSLGGFQIQITLNRPDIVYFEVDTVIVDLDTSYVCAFDTSGTLISGWELVEARCPGGHGVNIRLAGLHQFLTGSPPPPIGTYTSGTLLKIFARVRTDLPSFVEDSTVELNPNTGVSYCSAPQGGLIFPVKYINGSVTMVAPPCDCAAYCNLDGVAGYTPLDVTYIVKYVYKQQDARSVLPDCPGDNGDWNCDGLVSPLDVSWYVQFVYKSSNVGPCNPCDCAPYHTGCPAYP